MPNQIWHLAHLALLASLAANGWGWDYHQPLTFEDRVNAQEAIERVYDNHRIWPRENPSPKPPFEQMITREQLIAKVEDALRKSATLEKFWQRPLTAEQLQAEMDRMTKGTRDPVILRELFAALDDDPYLIAECLARPVLADRLVRNWYAFDSRFHGDLREEAEALRRRLTPQNFSDLGGGRFQAVEIVLEDRGLTERRSQGSGTLRLDEEEFERVVHQYPEEGDLSPVVETADAFLIRMTEGRTERGLQGGVIAFPKRPFDRWFEETQAVSEIDLPALQADYVLPAAAPAERRIAGYRTNNLSMNDPGSAAGRIYATDWTATPAGANSPAARYSHSAVWTGTEMIVWGGSDGAYFNTGGRYTPATDSWTDTSAGANCPAGRYDHTAVWTGTEMIVWGGYAGGYFNTGGRYAPGTDTWSSTSTGTDCPSARGKHTAVWTGTEMIVWGGSDGAYFNTGGRYIPGTDSWTATSTGTECPSPRYKHTAVWTGTQMIIWGGYSGGYSNTGARYTPGTDAWAATATGGDCPSGRQSHTAVWTGTEMIVWGGYAGGYFNTGGRYAPGTNTWTATSTDPDCPSARGDGHTAVWTGTEMIVWGGKPWNNTGGRFSPGTNSWAATPADAACPSARFYHSAVWAGTEMIVWGGYGSSPTIKSDGGRYDPGTNAWTPTSTGSNCPGVRNGHAAVWTGTEMIVWGGFDGGYLNTGGLYAPGTDSWTATSTGTNCPGARQDHTAVWTGSVMVVWGGRGSTNHATGGRYTPGTDSWTATATAAPCPSARYGHTAVWTGTQMIVWGGTDGGYLNTGGRYAPGTDAWTATATGGECPSARQGHTAVWTTAEMIVWGGTDGAYLNTGARYIPGTDIWTATATGAGCPQARDRHTAIWTGTEMIVWGGTDGGYLNTGGRYAPGTGAWTPTSAGGDCPSARYDHTAVWTGTEMIVWGGRGSGLFATGGRYAPGTGAWIATSTGAGCPAARYDHTAVWTDAVMIVWGGYGGDELNDGGIYNPVPPCFAPSGLAGNTAADLDACAGTGVQITWSMDPSDWGDGGSGIRTCDLLRDGAAIQTDIAYGTTQATDETGTDGQLYTYSIRYANGCALSAVTPGADAADGNEGPGAPAIDAITDGEPCAQSGVLITFTGGAGATGHDLYRDGILAITGFASGAVYDSGDSASHDYFIRAIKGACHADSPQQAAADANDAPTPTISGPDPACGPAALSTEAYASYQWRRNGSTIPGATGQSYEAVAYGTYSVDVSNAAGCGAASPGFVVSPYPSTPVISGPSEGCGSAALATGIYATYQWIRDGVEIPGATGQNYEAPHSGVYTVRVGNAEGCTKLSGGKTVTIHNDSAVAIGGEHVNLCPDTAVALSTGVYASYQWRLNGEAITGADAQAYAATVTGNYSVAVVDGHGCPGVSSEFAVFVDFCPETEVSAEAAIFPLRIAEDSGSGTGYYLYFQRVDSVDGYNIYEGAIGSWYSHGGAPGNACGASVSDLGTGEMRTELAPGTGSHYYLVTAFGGGVEGPSGFDSGGVQVPEIHSSCVP